MDQQAGHLEQRPRDPCVELGRVVQSPVDERTEVVHRVPVGTALHVLLEHLRGCEQGAVDRLEVVQTRPGEEVRARRADRVVGAERVRPQVAAHELVDLPERHVGGLVEAGRRQGEAAEQDVEHERPAVGDRHRDEPQRPQQLGDRGGFGLDGLEDLVDLVWKGRMGDAHAELGRRETRGHRPDLDVREGRPEDVVVGALEVELLRDRLEQEARPEGCEQVRQPAAVVGQPDDVAHDGGGAVGPERPDQPRVVTREAVGDAGEVERDDRNGVGRKARTELHGLAGANDAVGA